MTTLDTTPPATAVRSYNWVSKALHWTTALLILAVIPLGIIANGMPYDTGEELARKAFVFSIHKTVGVAIFFVALARIAWAFSQPKPGPLHPERRLETFLAETVHWVLYASLVLVPLTGWIHHAATTGFAPIWWPFGQSLPFVPKDDGLAHTFASLHLITERVLVTSLVLHIAGALKHHIVDKDVTLRRMLPVQGDFPAVAPHRHRGTPAIAAVAAFVAAMGIGAGLGLFAQKDIAAVPEVTLNETPSGWVVQDGTLGISVTQLGSLVSGNFEDWAAAIEFSPDTGTGTVRVDISIPSLTLGSVTQQAMGPDFFAVETHPTALFEADIVPVGEAFEAQGTLTVKGTAVPVTLPFTLDITDGLATMEGSTEVSRTEFNVGESFKDETSLAFAVGISVALTARVAEDTQ